MCFFCVKDSPFFIASVKKTNFLLFRNNIKQILKSTKLKTRRFRRSKEEKINKDAEIQNMSKYNYISDQGLELESLAGLLISA